MFDVKWSKEFTYYLGYLWADGNVKRTDIRLEIVESDYYEISDHLNKIDFIKFNLYRRYRNIDKWKPQMAVYFCDVKLFDSFFSKYFINKSQISPDKLLEVIPNELKRYFFNGLIDGDGNFYISNNSKIKQFSISSTYNQDWSYIIELFKKLNINKYDIKRIKNIKSKSSCIRISNYNDINKLYKYLYPNGFEIGLKRKYEKSFKIINNKPKYTCNNSFIEKKELLHKIEELKNINIVSKYFNCSRDKIINYCKKYNIYKEGYYTNKKMNKSDFLSLEESTIYMRKIGIKSKKEWVEFCKNGNRPKNIPSNPYDFYKNLGWISYGDWLGFNFKK